MMKRGNLIIKNKIYPVNLALSYEEKERGLMRIKPPVEDLLFVYAEPQDVYFWMKNTPAPLDIIFCCNGKIVDIKHGNPYDTTLIKPAGGKADIILETNLGNAKKRDINVGDHVFLKEDKYFR